MSLNITFKVPSPSPGIIRLRKQSAPKYAASPMCVFAHSTLEEEVCKIWHRFVIQSEQLYSGRIKHITTDVPRFKGTFHSKGGRVDGERGGMAVIQYQTIEHLNLRIGYCWRSFSCHISFARKGLLRKCFFYIGKNVKKIFKEQLRFSDVSNNRFGWAS